MLDKVLHHKLLTQGEQGQGVVTERHYQSTGRDGSAGPFYEIQAHLKFPDGSQTEFKSEMLNENKIGYLEVGAIIPVRYDVSDHSKVVLDVPALEAQKGADHTAAEAGRQDAIAQADAQLAEANAPDRTDN